MTDFPFICRCAVGSSECDLRVGQEKPEKLPVSGTPVLQADDFLHQQLGAHQDYKIGQSVD